MEFEIKQLQAEQFDILQKVADICEKNGITYFLAYETLLNAVKYNNYSEECYETSIMLPRADFDQLRFMIRHKCGDELFFQDYETDMEFVHCNGRIVKNNTTYITKNDELMDINHGVYINIYGIDGCPVKPGAQKQRIKKMKTLQTMLALDFIKKTNPNLPFMTKVGYFFLGLWKKIIGSRRLKLRIAAEIKRCSYKYSLYADVFHSDIKVLPTNINKKENYVSLGKVGSINFNGRDFLIPFGYKEYLANVYGEDYENKEDLKINYDDVVAFDLTSGTMGGKDLNEFESKKKAEERAAKKAKEEAKKAKKAGNIPAEEVKIAPENDDIDKLLED